MDARIFAALGDPTRLGLLVELAQHSPKTATELKALLENEATDAPQQR